MENKIMVTKSFLPPLEEYGKEIEKIWETNWLTNMGPLHNKFKERLKLQLKSNNISLFTNGHQALEVALKSLKLKKGGEIITTPFTFASTTHAIVNTGYKPVFCDIKLNDYNIDEEKIESLITKNTVAIMPVHVFGNPCNVKKIEEIANKNNLKVIYDAAHAFNVSIEEKGIGEFGDVSMFSLHATKVFNSIEGGVLSYKDNSFSERFKRFKNFGIKNQEEIDEIGGNAKMNEFSAAMGIVNLRYLEEEIDNRKKIVNKYRNGLKDIKGIRCLEDQKAINHNYAYFPILINKLAYGVNRDELVEKLKDKNIFVRKYFYPLVTNFECYEEEYKDIKLPNSEYVSKNIIILPLYGSLKIEEVEYIIECIRNLEVN